jgi:hypothetical protein
MKKRTQQQQRFRESLRCAAENLNAAGFLQLLVCVSPFPHSTCSVLYVRTLSSPRRPGTTRAPRRVFSSLAGRRDATRRPPEL